jgi:hypothetical protein
MLRFARRIVPALVALTCISASGSDGVTAARGSADDPASHRIAEVDLSSTTLEHAFDVLSESAHANIVVRWPAMEAAGVRRTTPVRLRMWDVRLGTALDVLSASFETGIPLAWSEQGGIITVSTHEDIQRTTTVAVYDVRDLIDVVRKSPLTGVPFDETHAQVVDEVARLINECVGTGEWLDGGGRSGWLRELAGRLIVTQSADNHRKIRDLLKQLRTEFARPMPVPATRPAATAPTEGLVLGGKEDRVRFYDVRDILKAIADADELRGAKPRTAFEVEAQLVGVVVENVGRDHWETATHGINMIAGRLVVNQSPEVHQRLKEFLANVRRELLAPTPSRK